MHRSDEMASSKSRSILDEAVSVRNGKKSIAMRVEVVSSRSDRRDWSVKEGAPMRMVN